MTGPASQAYVVVWLLLVFAWAANFVIRIGFSALLPPIIAELELSYARAGVLAAAFFWAYVAIQIPAGLLGDRFGRRRVLLLGLVGGALAAALTGAAGSFATLLLARILTGAGQGSLFSNDRAIIVAVTPPDKIGLGQGISFSGPGLGITLGLLLGGVLADRLPWRVIFWLFALGPILAALLIWRYVPSSPRLLATHGLGVRLRTVVRHRSLWTLALVGACGIYVQFVLATWAPLFFREAGVAELARAGGLASLQGIAATAGLVAGGWMDDRLRRRGHGHTAVIVTGLLALTLGMAAMAMVIAHRSPLGLALVLFVAAFFCWSIWGAVYALIGEMVSAENLGTAFGLYNSLCFLGAVVGPPLTGWTRDLAGSFAPGCALAALVALIGAASTLAVRPRPDDPRQDPSVARAHRA